MEILWQWFSSGRKNRNYASRDSIEFEKLKLNSIQLIILYCNDLKSQKKKNVIFIQFLFNRPFVKIP